MFFKKYLMFALKILSINQIIILKDSLMYGNNDIFRNLEHDSSIS